MFASGSDKEGPDMDIRHYIEIFARAGPPEDRRKKRVSSDVGPPFSTSGFTHVLLLFQERGGGVEPVSCLRNNTVHAGHKVIPKVGLHKPQPNIKKQHL